MAEKSGHVASDWPTGEAGELEDLVPLVYGELRRLAAAFLRGERQGSLQATALVHEAYLRLLGDGRPPWNDRVHFFRAAAQAMRRILIEHARARRRQKRGGELRRTSLGSAIPADEALSAPEALLDLDRALGELEAVDPEWVRVIELRYFAGLTVEESAQALGLSPRTVNRHWTVARAWLHARLQHPPIDASWRDSEPSDA